ncbi:hypothetical protein [uncultured Clostridium sp.]|jgi:hypothetical protein|uniref:hypothetical protein n=1 Tax=uncultured Clostridium sp. TaxID=59620 RepID=UPI0026370DF5|nr:hypothetical protein [uncultured Clostridium sp.]
MLKKRFETTEEYIKLSELEFKQGVFAGDKVGAIEEELYYVDETFTDKASGEEFYSEAELTKHLKMNRLRQRDVIVYKCLDCEIPKEERTPLCDNLKGLGKNLLEFMGEVEYDKMIRSYFATMFRSANVKDITIRRSKLVGVIPDIDRYINLMNTHAPISTTYRHPKESLAKAVRNDISIYGLNRVYRNIRTEIGINENDIIKHVQSGAVFSILYNITSNNKDADFITSKVEELEQLLPAVGTSIINEEYMEKHFGGKSLKIGNE